MAMIDIAERRGDIPSCIEMLASCYSFILNDCTRHTSTGADFAAAIRRYCDCDSNPRNELAADVAEKYVIAVEVFPDGAARIQYTKSGKRRQQ